MVFTILDSKLFIPRPRASTVPRTRLVERLNGTLKSKLTLVSGPPGFGKTTLLAEWVASLPVAAGVAWLSLEESDNDPVTFWSYVTAAIQRATSEAGGAAGVLLESPRQAGITEILTTLLNELNTVERDVVLVLDDYHVISAADVHDGMTFLVEHLPPRLHVVIASRADPPLPLARMRARGELLEVRSSDLRFSATETAAYFNETMGLALTASDLGALEDRTEGWIAALQLAALSMQGRDDVSGFIDDFAGDHRYIVDYLVQEILQKQTERVRAFLIQTSVLDRLGGDLCREVTGVEDSEAVLRYLEEGNVFLIPLDERRQWFRYHHLFADVLRARLVSEMPEQVAELHRRASRWFEQNSDIPAAIRHAHAAQDFGRAASLVELTLPSMLRSRQDATLRAWLDALPHQVLRLRPVLSTGYVSLLLHHGELDPVEGRLRDAESALVGASPTTTEQQSSSTEPVYVDEAQFQELPGMIALYRAAYAQVRGNLADTATYARKALDLMAEDAPLRGGAMALLGLALWSSGDLEAAHRTYAEGIALTHQGGYVNDSSTIMLADLLIAQGRLREALGTYRQALQRANEQGAAAPKGVADLHVGISELLLEQGDLDAALAHLAMSKELGESAGLPENRYRWFTAMAGVKSAHGAFDAALDLLDQAERLYRGGFAPDVRPIAALRARVWIAQGRLTEASAWWQGADVSPAGEPSYLHEFGHITLARLLLARDASGAAGDSLPEAVRLLKHLLSAAEAGGRAGAVIEVLVLLALAYRRQGDTADALEALGRALELAEPEGYLRVFVDQDPAMVALLEEVVRRSRSDYATRLLAAFQRPKGSDNPIPTRADHETLSERELEVVRLLSTDLSGPDIARELIVSLNTMRTHTKSIYTKLGVNSRRAAVRRAEELHLL